ncbi:hypothetical protein [Flammeovirga agarivorans]|uniref:Uncharacterized protein n=1 Tax=Flammeovirga agarivorans TaxID=2726742 RepID=A0A7X8SHJ8_9BACT|nr:hypothetical protein [Flammeovirga agarivorans]NLR90375.1 hypothetical protein [Flammeovirga agarivorans]
MRPLSKREQDIISVIKTSLRESMKFGFISDYMSLLIENHKEKAQTALDKLCPHVGAQEAKLSAEDVMIMRKVMELVSEPDMPFVNIIHPYQRDLAKSFSLTWLYNLAEVGTPMVKVPSYLK